ncbi:unnamed protein product [Lathyrus oleraceus]
MPIFFFSFCKALKEDKVLGVKHCSLFNLALLNKWKWHILNDDSSLWSGFLSCRYGDVKWEVLGRACKSRKTSLWWKDLCLVGEPVGSSSLINWFSSSISCKLGNMMFIDFWRHHGLGSYAFDVLFPSLFQICVSSRLKVGEAGAWSNNSWVWDISFNGINLSGDDALLLEELFLLLYGMEPRSLEGDHFV